MTARFRSVVRRSLSDHIRGLVVGSERMKFSIRWRPSVARFAADLVKNGADTMRRARPTWAVVSRMFVRFLPANPMDHDPSNKMSLADVIKGHKNNFNLIRLLLAISVIYYHSWDLTKSNRFIDYVGVAFGRLGYVDLSLGTWAVDCFFFLSGLFVTQSIFRDKSAVNFVIRRFCRLWPGLFVCLVITAGLACVVSECADSWLYLFEPSFYNYIIDNSLFHMVWQIPGVFGNRPNTSVNGSIHTLPIEAVMYAILLFTGILGILRYKISIFIVGMFLCGLSTFHYDLVMEQLGLSAVGQSPMAMFFAGVAVFAIADYINVRALLLALLLGIPVLLILHTYFFLVLSASAVAILLIGQVKFGWRPKSDLSYGIYIYGWPSQQLILTWYPNLNAYTLFLVSSIIAIILGYYSWHLVERPAISFGRGLTFAWTEFLERQGPSRAVAKVTAIPSFQRFAVVVSGFVVCLSFSAISRNVDLAPVSFLDVSITGYGPTETRVGVPFNVQPNGEAAIWVGVDKRPPDTTTIVFDGHVLETTIDPGMLTAYVPASLFSTAGDKVVLLEYRAPGRRERSASVVVRVTN